MFFNPDISKQDQKVASLRKPVKTFNPVIFFNNIPVACCSRHKDLAMELDEKLNFGHYINENIAKARKGISVIKKLYNFLPLRVQLFIIRLWLFYLWPIKQWFILQ